MPFNGQTPTYIPTYAQGQTQSQQGQSILQDPSYQAPDYMSAAYQSNIQQAAAESPYQRTFSGGMSNPNAINMNPSVTQAWANPTASLVGSQTVYSGNPMTSALEGMATGAATGAEVGGPIGAFLGGAAGAIFGNANGEQKQNVNTYQMSWDNPFQPVSDYFSSKFPSLSDVNSKFRVGQQYQNSPTLPTPYSPWELSSDFNSMTPQQFSQINPIAFQSAYENAAQNVSNAYANPNFQGGNTGVLTTNPNHVLTGDGTTQSTYGQWMNNAYNQWTAKMNQYHLF